MISVSYEQNYDLVNGIVLNRSPAGPVICFLDFDNTLNQSSDHTPEPYLMTSISDCKEVRQQSAMNHNMAFVGTVLLLVCMVEASLWYSFRIVK